VRAAQVAARAEQPTMSQPMGAVTHFARIAVLRIAVLRLAVLL
jgi:hypothetical protein